MQHGETKQDPNPGNSKRERQQKCEKKQGKQVAKDRKNNAGNEQHQQTHTHQGSLLGFEARELQKPLDMPSGRAHEPHELRYHAMRRLPGARGRR